MNSDQIHKIGITGLMGSAILWLLGKLKECEAVTAEIREDFVDYVTMTVEVLKNQ
jgi:hypothetical protein